MLLYFGGQVILKKQHLVVILDEPFLIKNENHELNILHWCVIVFFQR